MAKLSVREYEQMAETSHGTLVVGKEPALAKYSIVIGGGSTMGQPFNVRTKFIRLQCDVNCSFDIDLLPSAVVGQGSMLAGTVEYFGVQPEASHRVAVVAE